MTSCERPRELGANHGFLFPRPLLSFLPFFFSLYFFFFSFFVLVLLMLQLGRPGERAGGLKGMARGTVEQATSGGPRCPAPTRAKRKDSGPAAEIG
jgi:hypothetical protein